MAKRPSSNPPAKVDVVKSPDPLESTQGSGAEPVTMEEPPRPVLDPATPDYVETEIRDVSETEAETESETKPERPDVQPETDRPSEGPPSSGSAANVKTGRSAFLGTALGGIVAAAAGYALAVFVPFPGIGDSDAPPVANLAQVQALAARVETLEAAPEPDPTLADRIAELEGRPMPTTYDLAPLNEALIALQDRVAGIESRDPVIQGDSSNADIVALVEALRAEVAEIQASGADASAEIEALAAQTEGRLAEAEAQAAALRAEAEITTRRAVSAAALARVQAALESGSPFVGALSDISNATVSAELATLAETGVPTLSALIETFPPAARAALEESLRAQMGEGWSDRIGAFLQATTGARSLIPREGSDPDAVLSRAEAFVRAGDIEQALTELQDLPPEGLAEMSDWATLAQQRLNAVAAVAALSAEVEG